MRPHSTRARLFGYILPGQTGVAADTSFRWPATLPRLDLLEQFPCPSNGASLGGSDQPEQIERQEEQRHGESAHWIVQTGCG
jgi:hypothetical protein